MQLLERPALLDKPIRQPIEQFRMRRLFAHPTEIAGRANQALSEMVLPDAVDDDSSRQRVFRAGNPAAPASTGADWCAAGQGRQVVL